ncbi:MAG: deoxyribose-phosphate aldolase [Acidobacteriota bacterium]|nr:deoxyribose-phosphate aldolase [Acidobacteriota bacterium]
MSPTGVAQIIDHTILKPDAVREDILRVCREALEYQFASVCVNPYWIPLAVQTLAGSTVKACSVVAFPFGATSTIAKVAETAKAIEDGAREIDMVINIGALLSADVDTVRADIAAVVKQAHAHDSIVKVIIETALLTDDQKIRACHLAAEAGADFVKTSTGFAPSGATVADVELMRRAVGLGLGVKASGGIRTYDQFQKMIAAGASRIGASSGIQIVHASRA